MKSRSILTRQVLIFIFFFTISGGSNSFAQNKDSAIVKAIITEATGNSQLQNLAHQFIDIIGPRLVGTPQMQQAHDWAVNTYKGLGIEARNEKWGEWRGWERGVCNPVLRQPVYRCLAAMAVLNRRRRQ